MSYCRYKVRSGKSLTPPILRNFYTPSCILLGPRLNKHNLGVGWERLEIPKCKYRVTHNVVLLVQLISNQKLRYSIRSMYSNATFCSFSTKPIEHCDVSPCTSFIPKCTTNCKHVMHGWSVSFNSRKMTWIPYMTSTICFWPLFRCSVSKM